MSRFFTALWSRIIRDFFAGHALAGLCANGAGAPNEQDAELAYEIADAMMVAREAKRNRQENPGQGHVAPF